MVLELCKQLKRKIPPALPINSWVYLSNKDFSPDEFIVIFGN
jgi:hypothetical protein